jgi:hypothetical protein
MILLVGADSRRRAFKRRRAERSRRPTRRLADSSCSEAWRTALASLGRLQLVWPAVTERPEPRQATRVKLESQPVMERPERRQASRVKLESQPVTERPERWRALASTPERRTQSRAPLGRPGRISISRYPFRMTFWRNVRCAWAGEGIALLLSPSRSHGRAYVRCDVRILRRKFRIAAARRARQLFEIP